MPGIIAHALCGEKAIINSGCDRLRKMIKNNHEVFVCGCQGPDPYLFYGTRPWAPRKSVTEVRTYSDMIHERNVNLVFEGMLERVKQSNDEAEIAYLAGYLTHNVLDSSCHPYVYYKTDSTKGDTYPAHQLFECQIDLGMLNLYGLTVKDYRIDKLIKTKTTDDEKMAEVCYAGIQSGFAMSPDKHQLTLIFEDMKRAESILYDPNGNKGFFLSILEKILNKPGLATSMLTPLTYDNQLDAMNYRKDDWFDPTDEKIKRNDTFEQMFNSSASRASMLLEKYEQFIEDKCTLQEMLATIDNRNYCTGYSEDRKMYYFEKDHS